MGVRLVAGLVVFPFDEPVPLIDSAPVDDLPEGFHVISPDILVLEIIGVLPYVDHQKRDRVPCNTQLVVPGLEHDQLLRNGLVGEHAPAIPLDLGCHSREMRLEFVVGTEMFLDVDGSARSPRRRSPRSSSAWRRHPSEADTLAEAGDEASLRKALELEPDHAGATEGLARILIDRGEPAEALTLLAAPARDRGRPGAGRRGSPAEAGVDVSATGRADIEAKLNELLDRVRDDDAARQEFVDLLEAMGPDDPSTKEYRRALTARLY